MLVRLIHVTTPRPGVQARREEVLDVPVLRIGRDTDSDLQLDDLTVPLQHSRIEERRDGLWHEIFVGEASGGASPSRDVRRIEPGQVLRVGPFDLRVLPARANEGLAVEVERRERKEDEIESLMRRTRLGIERGLLTRRKLAWALALGLTAAAIALPLAPAHLGLRWWSSGAIARVHATTAQKCEACHKVPFENVGNEACLQCHPQVARHASWPASRASAPPDPEARRCAGCHPEHRGADGLAQVSSRTCVACHGDLHPLLPDTQLPNVVEFAPELHPQFRIALRKARPRASCGGPDGHSMQASDQPRVEIVPTEWSAELKETPGMCFSHLRHVGRVVPFPDGTKDHLRCDACHHTDAAGKRMQPIVFEDHCQSCHSLGFDLVLGDRQALHGDPAAMRQDLRGLYSDLAIRGRYPAPGAPHFAAPGRDLTPAEQQSLQTWVDGRVRAADRYVMGDRGECRRCHESAPAPACDGGADVAPVAVASAWMPRSEFRHATHAPFQCRDCHAAAAVYDSDLVLPLDRRACGEPRPEASRPPDSTAGHVPRPVWSEKDAIPFGLSGLGEEGSSEPSESASDLLVPGIERCTRCHAGPAASAPQVASECVLCHPFHREGHGAIGQRDPKTIGYP